MIPALIIPPAPRRKARRPAPQPASPAVQCPTRGTRPAIAPPPVLDALAMDAEWVAFCDERADGDVERQDSDRDAEWADLPDWMHRCAGTRDGRALGAGEGIGGVIVWSQPVGDA